MFPIETITRPESNILPNSEIHKQENHPAQEMLTLDSWWTETFSDAMFHR